MEHFSPVGLFGQTALLAARARSPSSEVAVTQRMRANPKMVTVMGNNTKMSLPLECGALHAERLHARLMHLVLVSEQETVVMTNHILWNKTQDQYDFSLTVSSTLVCLGVCTYFSKTWRPSPLISSASHPSECLIHWNFNTRETDILWKWLPPLGFIFLGWDLLHETNFLIIRKAFFIPPNQMVFNFMCAFLKSKQYVLIIISVYLII